MNIIFFGSTDDSILGLEALVANSLTPVAVVTQPAKPVGRDNIITKTSVELWAASHSIPVCTFQTMKGKAWLFENEQAVIDTLTTFKPDLLVTMCYGQKIPSALIHDTRLGGVNVHPSLLPRWRGAYPVPWTILMGDKQTGVTLITLSDDFDEGVILSQKKIPLTGMEYAFEVRKTLFTDGAHLLPETIRSIEKNAIKGVKQNTENATRARRMKREDGFVPWDVFIQASTNIDMSRDKRQGLIQEIDAPLPIALDRMVHALSPWPGVWTTITAERTKILGKRLKVLETKLDHQTIHIQTVQLEGKTPVSWEQFRKSNL